MIGTYLIGSLRNPRVPEIANELRRAGIEVYDDWYSPGPEADEYWQKYENLRGRAYKEAVNGHHAQHVFEVDLYHLNRLPTATLVLPAGRSAHMELGYKAADEGSRTYVLFDQEPERFDIMYRFADDLCFSVRELIECLKNGTSDFSSSPSSYQDGARTHPLEQVQCWSEEIARSRQLDTMDSQGVFLTRTKGSKTES